MLTPLPHQVGGINYLIENNGGAIFSEPRTGKTLMVIRAIKHLESYPAIVICPASVMVSWHGALIEDGVNEESILIMDLKIHKCKMDQIINKLFNESIKWIIVNYEKVVSTEILSFYQNISSVFNLPSYPKAIILDESYRIASFESNISQYLMDNHIQNIPEDQVRIVMTGTPISENQLDAVQQYMFIHGYYFGYNNPFTYRNKMYYEIAYKWVCKSKIHSFEVKEFIKKNSYQVKLKDLNLGGEILRGVKLIPMNDKQTKLYEWVALSNHYIHPVKNEEVEMISPVKSMFFHKIAAGLHPLTNEVISDSKAEAIFDIVNEENKKAVVFSRFTKIIPSIIQYLRDRYIECESITGLDSLEERDRKRERFQKGDLQIIVAQVNATARGLDFSSADYLIYHNNSYSYEVRGQSELRAQNIKRVEPYTVIDLCCMDSIDVSIRDILDKKKTNVNQYIKELTQEQLSKWGNYVQNYD
jgi:SNF2 family DNA or RNA helicase